MRILKGAFCITVVSIFLFACTSEEEKVKHQLTEKVENKEEKVKRQFTEKVDNEIKVLQANEMKIKDNPKCKLNERAVFLNAMQKGTGIEHEVLNIALYRIITDYEYDINKTTSLVTPYIAKAGLIGIGHVKSGKTLQDCLNSDWESSGEEVLFMWQKYAYQDGKWILKKD